MRHMYVPGISMYLAKFIHLRVLLSFHGGVLKDEGHRTGCFGHFNLK